jgi:RNA polymerase sigma factor (sigma-70 family)
MSEDMMHTPPGQGLIRQEAMADLYERYWFIVLRTIQAMDYYRRRARLPLLSLQEEDETWLADEERSPENIVVQREEQLRLHSQIAFLPELQQELLRLRFTDGLRSKEIAARLRKNEGTVRSLLSRTLNGLRGLYATPPEEKECA